MDLLRFRSLVAIKGKDFGTWHWLVVLITGTVLLSLVWPTCGATELASTRTRRGEHYGGRSLLG